MPFIKTDLEDLQEDKPVPEGEYDLKIAKAEEKKSKEKGYRMCEVMVTVQDPDYPDATPIFEYLLNPEDAPDEKVARLWGLNIKRFCAVFDLGLDFDVDNLPGSTGTCYVEQEEDDDGNPRNTLRLPRLKE